MRGFDTIATLFARGRRRTAKAQGRLRDAYVRVFEGTGDREDADLVFVDLARRSGYYYTTHPQGVSDRDIWFKEGQRALFARIVQQLNLPQEALNKLAEAVILEDHASHDEKEEL